MNYFSIQLCEEKPTGFALFNSFFLEQLIFEYDFTFKKREIGEQNLYSTQKRLGRDDIYCVEDNHSQVCRMCAKGLLDSNFDETVIEKYNFFKKLPQI